MLVETQEAILARISDQIPAFATIDGWQGELEDLLKVPRNLPSFHLAYGEGEFGDQPVTIGGAIARKQMVWNAIITASNRRDRTTGAVECYQLMEAVVAALKKFNTGYGWLWPAADKLLYAKGGLAVYGVSFVVENDQ